MNASDSRVNRVDRHIGGQLLQTDFHVLLQGLDGRVDRLLDFAVNLL